MSKPRASLSMLFYVALDYESQAIEGFQSSIRSNSHNVYVLPHRCCCAERAYAHSLHSQCAASNIVSLTENGDTFFQILCKLRRNRTGSRDLANR